MKVAVVVGHRESVQGAKDVREIREWEFHSVTAEHVSEQLRTLHIDHDIAFRPDVPDGYSKLADNLNDGGFDLIVELHFNGGVPKARGTETLCYPGSERGRVLAEAIQRRMVTCLELRDRGVKEQKTNDRGKELLTLTRTRAPAVILETHFGSNRLDTDRAYRYRRSLGYAIANGIHDAILRLESK